MAIVNNGTKLAISTSLFPTGFTPPVITDFNDFEYKRELNLNVLRSTVQNTNKATTLTNILDDATVGINKQITDILTADYVGTNDVQVFSQLVSLGNNIEPSVNSDFFNAQPVSYTAKVIVYIKTV